MEKWTKCVTEQMFSGHQRKVKKEGKKEIPNFQKTLALHEAGSKIDIF